MKKYYCGDACLKDNGRGLHVKFKNLNGADRHISFTYSQALQLLECLSEWNDCVFNPIVTHKSKISGVITCKMKDTCNGLKITFKSSSCARQDEIITLDYSEAADLKDCLEKYNQNEF